MAVGRGLIGSTGKADGTNELLLEPSVHPRCADKTLCTTEKDSSTNWKPCILNFCLLKLLEPVGQVTSIILCLEIEIWLWNTVLLK